MTNSSAQEMKEKITNKTKEVTSKTKEFLHLNTSEQEKLAKKLIELVMVDIDAVSLYTTALKNIDDSTIHKTINKFKDDHERHIKDLSSWIRDLKEKPPEKTPDLKGYLLKAFSAIRSITGTSGALAALETAEHITNKAYEEAVSCKCVNIPQELKKLLNSNYEDEKRHLNYVIEQIKKIT